MGSNARLPDTTHRPVLVRIAGGEDHIVGTLGPMQGGEAPTPVLHRLAESLGAGNRLFVVAITECATAPG